MDDAPGLRIDSWLWRARFFRTRSLAGAAARGGAVHVNGHRARASRVVRPGDRLEISSAAGRHEVTVIAVPQRRGPASETRECYRIDHHQPPPGRGVSRETAAPAPARRPGKQARRLLRRLKGR